MDLIRISLDKNFNILWTLSPWLVVVGLIALFIYLRINRNACFKDFEIDEAELGIGNAKVTVKPNREDLQIAYKLWVEANTRKVGLPLDPEHDVIVEIYDSWFEFFKITRELIKEIPASKVKGQESTRKLVTIAVEVLNVGIRPHLTQWQAKFRRWYELESKNSENSKLSPQEIQRKFPYYKVLIEDLNKVNKRLINYQHTLSEIVMCK